jgi:two-component system sensor histidine kinase HydH
MVLVVVAVVGGTAGAIGALSYSRASRALEEAAKTRLALLARDISEHLHGELEDRAADIKNWAHLEVMLALVYDDVDKQLAEFLRRSLQGRRIYRAIACLDPTGRIVAAAGSAEAIVGARASPDTRLSIVAGAEAEPMLLRLETPIFNPQRAEERIGTLVSLVDPERILDTIQASVQGMGAPVQLTLRQTDGSVVLRSGPRDPHAADRLLLARAAVPPLSAADGLPLEVIVGEPRAVALADVTALRAALLETGAAILMVSACFGALVAWRISRPIRTLTTTVRAIADHGRPEAPPAFPAAGGEVGVLSAAFRGMLESLDTAQREALAQARLAFLGEVAASIAHDVRTPLSVLKTSAQLLSRGETDEPTRRELQELVTAEVDRLNAVVSNLVDLARPAPVRYGIEPLGPIIDRAASFFRGFAEKRRIQVVVAGDASEALVRGSGEQLYQVLLNLVHNALQAMDGPGMLHLRHRREGSAVVVEVADSGPGFAPDVLPRVFAPFFTTKHDGTGLGLAIAKRIVEEHGGTIGARNVEGGGGCVWFRLSSVEATA